MGTATGGAQGNSGGQGENAMLTAARQYTRRGWRVVPVRPGEKGVTLSGWQQLRLEEDDLPRWFGGATPHNIGILTGAPSGGLIDVDCDAPEAVQAAQELLPPTGLISGRAGNPASHYWYQIEGAGALLATAKFVDGVRPSPPAPSPQREGPRTSAVAAGRAAGSAAGSASASGSAAGSASASGSAAGSASASGSAAGSASASGSGSPPSSGEGLGERANHRTMLIELRSTGGQTIAPPSLHPSGELVRWEHDGMPWGVNGTDLLRAVAKVAAVALLARHWPAVGERDEAAKDLAGMLLRGSWAEEEVDHFTQLAARIAGDEEWQKRGKARGTARKLAQGDPVTGGHALASRLSGAGMNGMNGGDGGDGGDGERVVALVRRWLGLSGLGGASVALSTEGDQRAPEGSQYDVMSAFDEDDRLRSVVARDVKKSVVRWLWQGRIPLGAITLLDGDPGLGKSLLTIDLTARVTTGRTMPDGTPGVEGGVVLLSAEDDLATTIRPRLEVAAANLDRVEIVCGVPEYNLATGRELERSFRLPLDIPRLERLIQRQTAHLVVIDPLMAYLGSTVNSWRDQDVRGALAPLAAMAERTGSAVLILRHLNKASGGNALYRGGGSIGIIGAARSGLLVAKHPDNPERERVLASTKSNLGPPMPALRYQLTAPLAGIEGLDEDGSERLAVVPAVEWLGECQFSATTLLAATDASGGKASATKREQARMWLRAVLESGPLPAMELEAEAKSEGISPATLARASHDIGIMRDKVGYASGSMWVWRLPGVSARSESPPKAINAAEDDHPQYMSAFEVDDHLRAQAINTVEDDQPQCMSAFDADDHLRAQAPTCPVTGGTHEYAQMRNAQGRLLCVECGYVRYDATMSDDGKGAQG